MIATLSAPPAPANVRAAGSPRLMGVAPMLAAFPDLTAIGELDAIAAAGGRQIPTGAGKLVPSPESAGPAPVAPIDVPVSALVAQRAANASPPAKTEVRVPRANASPTAIQPNTADVFSPPIDGCEQADERPAETADEADSETSPDQSQPTVAPTAATVVPMLVQAITAPSPPNMGAENTPPLRPGGPLPAIAPGAADRPAVNTPTTRTAFPGPAAAAPTDPAAPRKPEAPSPTVTAAPPIVPAPARPEPQPATDPRAVVQVAALAADPALAAVHGPIDIERGTPPDPLSPPQRASDAPPVAANPPAQSTPPVPAITAGASAPAGQVFAAALHAAARDERTERDAPVRDTAPQPGFGAADLAPHAVAAAAPTTSADAGGGTLDLRDGRWPHAMIDRIERLRDDADSADTRIRLVPDRLGQIDVAVRREGDTLHVRFHAAEAETRALLADAQPRLAEIAQGRGLRLGDAQVGGGAAQGERQPPRPAPVPATSAAPRPATVNAADELSTDIRIA